MVNTVPPAQGRDVLDSVALDKYSLVRDVYLHLRRGVRRRRPLEDYDDDAGKLPPEDGQVGG
jgi:phospholipid-binding lipoprotein MlaA